MASPDHNRQAAASLPQTKVVSIILSPSAVTTIKLRIDWEALCYGCPQSEANMDLAQTDYDTPFNITRTSHVVLTVRDLEASRLFYTEVIGLMVTQQSA